MIDLIIGCLLDALLDSAKILPFLLIAFLIIEIIEHKLGDNTKRLITRSGKYGPAIGGLFGAIPQCGFSVLATNLYITRIISLGTLISIYLSTSDEMLPILISKNVDIKIVLSILLLKFIIGMCFGFIIDLLWRRKSKQDFHICEESECDCDESIIKSSIKHTFKTILFIFIVTLGLNVLLELVDINSITMIDNNFLAPFITSLLGLIPNCAASVVITELYLNELIGFGSMIGGLLTGSGVALLVLFRSNKNIKENLLILGLVYSIGCVMGIIINLFI